MSESPKAPAKKPRAKRASSAARLSVKARLWEMADKQRSHMDADAHKRVVLGLIFLEYIADAFEEVHARLVVEKIFRAPMEARWPAIQAAARQASFGKKIDDAMVAP